MPKKSAGSSLPTDRPPSIPEPVWDLAGRVGLPMATAIFDIDRGEWPSSTDAVADMLVVARDQETRAMRRWLALRKRYAHILDEAESEYREWHTRSSLLFGVATGKFDPEDMRADATYVGDALE